MNRFGVVENVWILGMQKVFCWSINYSMIPNIIFILLHKTKFQSLDHTSQTNTIPVFWLNYNKMLMKNGLQSLFSRVNITDDYVKDNMDFNYEKLDSFYFYQHNNF